MPRAYPERLGLLRNSQVGANGGLPRPPQFISHLRPYPRFSTKLGYERTATVRNCDSKDYHIHINRRTLLT